MADTYAKEARQRAQGEARRVRAEITLRETALGRYGPSEVVGETNCGRIAVRAGGGGRIGSLVVLGIVGKAYPGSRKVNVFLLTIVVIGIFTFQTQLARQARLKQQNAAAEVKSDLLAIAQGEKRYLVSQGTYADLDQLRREGSITFSTTNRWGYNYTAEIDDGQHFKIMATPASRAKHNWPILSIDETLEITQQ